tara:strand:+ start:125 stop:277 length:153 start_codon:yes stop_codon:yes gene_type:complete
MEIINLIINILILILFCSLREENRRLTEEKKEALLELRVYQTKDEPDHKK